MCFVFYFVKIRMCVSLKYFVHCCFFFFFFFYLLRLSPPYWKKHIGISHTVRTYPSKTFKGVNIALPTILVDLGMTTDELAWVLSAYSLTFGSLLTITGKLGDAYGHRTVYLLGLTWFAIWSLISGLSNSTYLLLVARALQGIGAAATIPNGLALITINYTGAARERAVGAFGGAGAIGFSVGLILGGVFTSTIGWRWTFYLSTLISGLQALFGLFILSQPALEEGRTKKVDWLGGILVTIGIFMIVYSLTEGSARGWGAPDIITLLVLGVVALVSFVIVEKYTHEPLMPLGIWFNVNFTPVFFVALCTFGGMSSLLYWLTELWENVRDVTPLNTAIQFLAQSISAIIFIPVAIIFVAKFGVRVLLWIGVVFVLALPLGTIFIDATSSYWGFAFPIFVVGTIGFASIAYGSILAGVNSAPKKLQGIVSGLLNTAQQAGGSIGLAITNAVASSTSNINPETATPDQLLKGYHNAIWTVFAIMCLSLIAAFFIQRVPTPEDDDDVKTDEEASVGVHQEAVPQQVAAIPANNPQEIEMITKDDKPQLATDANAVVA